MAVGLVALIPVLGIAGSVLVAAGVGSEEAAWATFGVGLVWIATMVWWSWRAPPARSREASTRYWVALRHAQFRPGHDIDDRAA